MPELPDLEVIREVLAPRIANVAGASVEVRRPLCRTCQPGLMVGR